MLLLLKFNFNDIHLFFFIEMKFPTLFLLLLQGYISRLRGQGKPYVIPEPAQPPPSQGSPPQTLSLSLSRPEHNRNYSSFEATTTTTQGTHKLPPCALRILITVPVCTSTYYAKFLKPEADP